MNFYIDTEVRPYRSRPHYSLLDAPQGVKRLKDKIRCAAWLFCGSDHRLNETSEVDWFTTIRLGYLVNAMKSELSYNFLGVRPNRMNFISIESWSNVEFEKLKKFNTPDLPDEADNDL